MNIKITDYVIIRNTILVSFCIDVQEALGDGWQFLNKHGKQYDGREKEHYIEMIKYDDSEREYPDIEEESQYREWELDESTQSSEDDRNYLTRTGIIR